VESCPLTKLDGGLIRLHSADESAVKWLTSHRTWSIRQQQLAPSALSLFKKPVKQETEGSSSSHNNL